MYWVCPQCKSKNDEDCLKCFCGHVFESEEQRSSNETIIAKLTAEKLVVDELRAEMLAVGEAVKERVSKNSHIPLTVLPAYPQVIRPFSILLSRYINRQIGINYEEPKEYSAAILTQVTDDFLSIYVPEKHITISYPLYHILNVVESVGGVSTGLIFKQQYAVVIEVFHLVVYSGAVGISIPIPR